MTLPDGIRKNLFPEAGRPDLIETDRYSIEAARSAAYERMTSHRARVHSVWKESGSVKAAQQNSGASILRTEKPAEARFFLPLG
ncbi:MAG: hypothetical protein OHK006_04560 [Thermodesulfovibrionales bacterium]